MKILLALSLSVILIMATITTISNVNRVAAQQPQPKPALFTTATWTTTQTPSVPMSGQDGQFVQVSFWDKVKSGVQKVGNVVQNTVQQAKKIANNAVREVKGILPGQTPKGHTPIRTPNQVAGDAMVHWYQFTNENLLDLGKAVAYTGGYLVGTKAAIAGVVASCTTVVACGGGIAVATPTVVYGTQTYYSKMKQLHGTGAKGDDILYPGKQLKDKDGTPCKISDVNIELLDSNYLVIQTGKSTSAKGSLGFGSTFGARLVNSRPGTSDTFVQVHWWYDMGSAVRYRPVYTVDHPSCTITR